MHCWSEDPDLLTRISEVSNIVLAFLTFVLAVYIFRHQREKDKQSIRLQWFKELIIEPNKSSIYSYFDSVIENSSDLKASQLTDIEKIGILSTIKSDSYVFRRNFIALLYSADQRLATDIQRCIDTLLDNITIATFDPSISLNVEDDFTQEIEIKIYDAKVYLFTRLFKHEG